MSSPRLTAQQSELLARRALSGFATWKELCQANGIRYGTLWSVLTGRRRPQRRTLSKIAGALGVTEDRLLQLVGRGTS